MIKIWITILLLAFVACSCSNKPGNEQSAKKGWIEYKEPNIFSIKHPKSWIVKFDKKNGKIKLSDKKGESVYIWPVYTPKPLNKSKGRILIRNLAAAVQPTFTWEIPQSIGSNSLLLNGSNKNESGKASLRWISDQNSSAAICYIVTAHRDYYKNNGDDLVGILSSFHPVLSNGKKSVIKKHPTIQFTRWVDPNEHAFTVEIPENWRIQGGLKRYSPSDYRPGVNLISPDKEINVFFMDPTIPFFSLPNQTLSMSGIYEGSYYTLQDGTRTFVRRYVPGVYFASEYAGRRFSDEFTNFFIYDKRNRPDIARIDNREYEQLNAANMGMFRENNTAGEVYFRGRRNGLLYSGYVEAATLMIESQYGGGLWQVQQLYGFTAPKSKTNIAVQVMQKLVSSFMWDPRWYMMQTKIRANVSEIVTRANEQISKMINQSFELGQKRMDKAMREFSDYILGRITLRDDNGHKFNVWNTSNYYWADKFNDVGGTKLFVNPDISRFRRLVKVK